MDHCPIILKYSSQLWGPKSFRFNNFWIEHRGLSLFIVNILYISLSFYHIITFIASLCYITFSLKVYIPNEVYTYYFHASVKGRCTKNFVLALRVGVRWVESVSEVCPEIVNYFTNHFPESVNNRPRSERH